MTLGVDSANQLEKETAPFDRVPWVAPCLVSTLLSLYYNVDNILPFKNCWKADALEEVPQEEQLLPAP